jgi:LCP family protein required for cell wall assembly
VSAGPPEYKLYRSKPGLLSRLRPRADRGLGRPRGPRRRPGRALGRALRPGRLVKYLVSVLIAWLLLSAAVFFLSAALRTGVSNRTEHALQTAPAQSLLTGSTILVLGSDARSDETREPGSGGPPRADSILLLNAGFGRVRRLSILRDSAALIPGHGTQKINASYALGGPALATRTVEGFLGNGLEIDHVIEVSFEEFPKLIDAMGGIDVTLKRCVRSQPFGGRKFSLGRGERHLNGRQALAFARVRKNLCAPNEDDRARARRQQEVLSAMRSRLLSPAAFPRLPFIAWQAPRTLPSDLQGLGLSLLFLDIVTAGGAETEVLLPVGENPDGTLIVSEGDKQQAVTTLLGD